MLITTFIQWQATTFGANGYEVPMIITSTTGSLFHGVLQYSPKNGYNIINVGKYNLLNQGQHSIKTILNFKGIVTIIATNNGIFTYNSKLFNNNVPVVQLDTTKFKFTFASSKSLGITGTINGLNYFKTVAKGPLY